MAYPNYYPQMYQPVNYSPVTSNIPTQNNNIPQQNNGITWVLGEASAKSYPVLAGQSILLMDSEKPVMYIKSTDQSGMPMPLRIFDYTERSATQGEATTSTDYVSREEFNSFKEEIKAEIRKPVPAKKNPREE